jgi:hypothetical protein
VFPARFFLHQRRFPPARVNAAVIRDPIAIRHRFGCDDLFSTDENHRISVNLGTSAPIDVLVGAGSQSCPCGKRA